MDRKTEFFHDFQKGSWKLKEDTLILCYRDSLNSIEEYVIVDTVLKKVMPVWSNEVRDWYKKEYGKELPLIDIRPFDMYGSEKEYFLIRKNRMVDNL